MNDEEPRVTKMLRLTVFPPGRPPVEIPGERVLVYDPHSMLVKVMAEGSATTLYVGVPFAITSEELTVVPARGLIVPGA